MSQMFFRLTHHDWVECFTKLSRAELGVLFYLRTLNPFGDRRLKINFQAIGEVLDIHRTSVSRALKKLEREDFIELEIATAQVKLKNNDSHTKQNSENDANPPLNKDSASSVHPRTGCASTHGDRASTHGTVHPRTIGIPESPPDKAFETPQTLQTYSDFKKTLSESERENFLKFVEDKTKNLEKPINDLEAWLASKNAANQNRWEVYHEKFKIEGTDKNALQKELEAKQRAIAYFQNRHNVKNEEIKGNKLENQENRVEAQIKPIGEGLAIANFTKRNNPKNAEIEPKNPNLEQNEPEILENKELEARKRAIAEFKKRINRDLPVDEPEPENTNEQEYLRQKAAFDELLSSSLGEKEESLAQRRRKARAEAKRQKQELARQRREAAAKYDEQQDPELQRRREIKLREIEEFILRDSQRRNSEITSEKPENE